MESNLKIKIVKNLNELIKVFIVRGIVFIEEQNVSYSIEKDEHELESQHILAEMNNEPIGAGRIRYIEDYAKLERIAVRKNYRGNGYGHRIVDFMMQTARKNGFCKFKMHAQAHLIDFYAEHGFETRGEKFKEADIDHYLMIKEETKSN
ncbi:MAG: GNAT family N-acetyltransferase [Candidatus Marinimicrobia bacterium]|nr:GNAT family N-acetyltransferase [Candidatus Neomarinimicrobiota bacterium]